MNAILVYAKFLGIWFGGALLAGWCGHLSAEVATFVGFSFALFWRIWVRLKAGEARFQEQLSWLHSCIEDPSYRSRIKEENLKASAVHQAILSEYVKKGMTPDEINEALRKWGEENEHPWIPSIKPSSDPKRLVPERATRKKSAIVYQLWWFDDGIFSPELWLEFRDDKLTGWKIKNCDGLPGELIAPYAKLYQAAKKG